MNIPEKQKNNIIRKKSCRFSLEAISLYKQLLNQKEYVLSKQFLKSATSIGANVEEALAAHSKNDFVAKMIIASKEARETRYWIWLMNESDLVKIETDQLFQEINEIISILTAIIKTTRDIKR